MATERTLSIIKPDATRRNLTGQIVARFEKAGLRVRVARNVQVSTLHALPALIRFKSNFARLRCPAP